MLDYTHFFSPNDYENNDKITYKYCKDKYDRRKSASLEFRLEKIDETRNFILEEIKHNDLISEKYKNTFKYPNYAKHLLILASTVTGCIRISAFASLVAIPVGITCFAVGIKLCAVTVEIKKYNSI